MERLLSFCRSAQVDDVMFFVDPMNLRHVTETEAKLWLDAMARAKPRLEQENMTFSINPLNTLTHGCEGLSLLEDQPFRLMVDVNGSSTGTAPCPLCPEWRAYLARMYRQYAALEPHTLWIEDDFRLHNHPPLEWGGCFCDVHLQRFARQLGVERLEREAFIAGLLSPGEPHPYRQVWLDDCRRMMIELAELLEQAIHGVSPATRIGLMTSDPAVHAAEARDWVGLARAFGSKEGSVPMVARPHLPVYAESVSSVSYAWEFNRVPRLTVALLPEETEIYPELENVPYTAYAKSIRFQQYQLETALLLGSNGCTLNIVDMSGNGLYPDPKQAAWLSELKPFLEQAAAMRLSSRSIQGVNVWTSQDSAYTLHTEQGATMEGLYPSETFWGGMLSGFGISNTFTTEAANHGVVAVSGQMLRNCKAEQIRSLFGSACVLLEGQAVQALVEMGLGDLCGVRKAQWRSLQTYEQMVAQAEYAGVSEAIMRPYLATSPCVLIEYEAQGVEILSQLCLPSGEVVAPGMTIFNEKVFILPYDQTGARGLFHPIRREVVQQFLQQCASPAPLMIANDAPHVGCYECKLPDGEKGIAIVNYSLDDQEDICLAGAGDMESWTLYNRLHPEGVVPDIMKNENVITIRGAFQAMSLTLLSGKPR
ncbi:hypothetical protein [Paenibacillus sp. 598K]|uniref:hypothetical protein n=1 Tax=Paenibacillus sp. 598K TaxID=1117987 RepID=UPI000FFED49C|nr:hypothetical protein [Paenibacillus sp. 598K]